MAEYRSPQEAERLERLAQMAEEAERLERLAQAERHAEQTLYTARLLKAINGGPAMVAKFLTGTESDAGGEPVDQLHLLWRVLHSHGVTTRDTRPMELTVATYYPLLSALFSLCLRDGRIPPGPGSDGAWIAANFTLPGGVPIKSGNVRSSLHRARDRTAAQSNTAKTAASLYEEAFGPLVER